MSKAPKKCPMCGENQKWIKVDTQKKGFSLGKATIGGVLTSAVGIGPIGLIGGALGKKKKTYCCGSCGFSHEYMG